MVSVQSVYYATTLQHSIGELRTTHAAMCNAEYDKAMCCNNNACCNRLTFATCTYTYTLTNVHTYEHTQPTAHYSYICRMSSSVCYSCICHTSSNAYYLHTRHTPSTVHYLLHILFTVHNSSDAILLYRCHVQRVHITSLMQMSHLLCVDVTFITQMLHLVDVVVM